MKSVQALRDRLRTGLAGDRTGGPTPVASGSQTGGPTPAASGSQTKTIQDAMTQLTQLRRRIDELESEVQENRRLNRRLAELTDVVQELLVPIAQRDEDKLSERLEKYAESL